MKDLFDWLWGITLKVLLWLAVFILIGKVLTRCEKQDIDREPYWKNIDPDKSTQLITDYDIDKRLIIYADTTPYQGEVNITKSSGIVIQTNITPEELLEQMDIDYHDVADYLGMEFK